MLKKKLKKISTILMLIGLIAAIAAPIALAETHYWHCQICGIRYTQAQQGIQTPVNVCATTLGLINGFAIIKTVLIQKSTLSVTGEWIFCMIR